MSLKLIRQSYWNTRNNTKKLTNIMDFTFSYEIWMTCLDLVVIVVFNFRHTVGGVSYIIYRQRPTIKFLNRFLFFLLLRNEWRMKEVRHFLGNLALFYTSSLLCIGHHCSQAHKSINITKTNITFKHNNFCLSWNILKNIPALNFIASRKQKRVLIFILLLRNPHYASLTRTWPVIPTLICHTRLNNYRIS